jgi:hypothetical protein
MNKQQYTYWEDWQTEFLVENYRYLSPKQIAEKVGLPRAKINTKMVKMNLPVLSTIDREQDNLLINRLIELGLERKEIAEIANVKQTKVDQFIIVKASNEKYKSGNPQAAEHHMVQYVEIMELKKLKLNNFIPDHEEDERWTYSDLSPSEQLIYHFIKPDYLIDFRAPVQQFKLIA